LNSGFARLAHSVGCLTRQLSSRWDVTQCRVPNLFRSDSDRQRVAATDHHDQSVIAMANQLPILTANAFAGRDEQYDSAHEVKAHTNGPVA
jgi:hypothetical protein